jgi:tetratricopeptide (TPR) repeat protein
MKEIIHFTGGHPMAMRLIVSQVTTAEKTLEDALKDMKEAKGRIFDYIFSRSLDLAGADGRKLFAAMAVFSPTASRKALQSVCGLSIAGFEGAIKRVAGLSLVESYEQGKRFSLHQLARAKAQELLESDIERVKYRQHAAQFFMELVNATVPMTRPEIAAKALGAPMLEGRSAQRIQDAAIEIFVKPAIKMLEMDLVNCLLALEWALDRGDLDAGVKLLSDLGDFMTARGYWDLAINYNIRISKDFRARGAHLAEAATLINLGMFYYNRGRWKESIEHFENALRIAREFQNKTLEAEALSHLGTIYAGQKNWSKAVKNLGASQKIFQDLGDEAGQANVANRLGAFYLQSRQWEKAIKCFEDSLRISERQNNKRDEAAALANLALCYWNQKEYEFALKHYERALKIYEDLGNKVEKGDVLNNLGLLYRDQGDLDMAMRCYQNSLGIKVEIGNRVGQPTVLRNIALLHSEQNQWMKAASACLESFQIAVEIHSSVVVDSVRVILQVSRTMLKSGEFAIPAQLAQQLSQFIQDTEVTDNEIRAALVISQGVLTIISFVAACEFNRESSVYREALELARSLDEKTGAALNLVNWLESDLPE